MTTPFHMPRLTGVAARSEHKEDEGDGLSEEEIREILDDAFAEDDVISASELADALEVNAAAVREFCASRGVARIGAQYAITRASADEIALDVEDALALESETEGDETEEEEEDEDDRLIRHD